jgi:integrase
MARTVRDARLDSRAARGKLAPRGKPYWRALDPGLHLGYRKPTEGAGKWVDRAYRGERKYTTETFATADDFSEANGVDVFNFQQAQAAARKRRDARSQGSSGQGPLTVTAAIEHYLVSLEARGRNSHDTRIRAERMILPALGGIEVAALTTDQLRKWFTGLATTPPRVRTALGQPQRYRKIANDEETARRRRSTANRIGAILKAALTHVYREGLAPSENAWRRVKLFENVTSARVRYLTVPEAQRLLHVCPPDFRNLVQAGLQTGCRYGELGRIAVRDFHADSGTIGIARSKTGRSRHVALTEEGVAFFSRLCAGRPGTDLMLRRANGEAWGPSNQIAMMAEASRRAGFTPSANFHSLRHTYASLSIMNGAPLVVVATNLGHANTKMVEKHYGHLARTYVAETIRATAPRFGTVDSINVVPLSRPVS